jgi:hypothetical protein
LYTLYPTVLPTASPLSADIRSATASDTEHRTAYIEPMDKH